MVKAARNLLISAALSAAPLLSLGSTAQALELTSPQFTDGASMALAQVNSRCGGGNESPALNWSGAPAETRSYALTLFDSDANHGHGFWHWLVVDVPAAVAGLPVGAGSGDGLPTGAQQAKNDFGDRAYDGPCPPPGSGAHHYEFTLYALGSPSTPQDPQTNDAALAAYLKSHALATALLVGLYKR
jgi:Raf kinase inhibitor-like YbhB/YbcL family protein